MRKIFRIIISIWIFTFVFISDCAFSQNTTERITQSSGIRTFQLVEERYEIVEELPAKVIKNLSQDINEQVAFFVRYFTQERREVTERWFKRCSLYLPYFRAIFKEQGIPEDLIYLAFIESGCNSFAVSRAGAVGIWQFMEGTAKLYGLKIDYWVDERRDFIKSTYAAARYLKRLYQIFGDWRPAVASYNLGEGRLMRILKARNFVDYWQLLNSGALPLETAAYLPQWMAITFIAKNPHKYGFKPIEEMTLNYEEIEVNGGVDLKVFALAGNIDPEILIILNAELRRQITPPFKSYLLKVPLGKKQEIRNNLHHVRTVLIEKMTPDGTIEIVSISQEQLRGTIGEDKEKARGLGPSEKNTRKASSKTNKVSTKKRKVIKKSTKSKKK